MLNKFRCYAWDESFQSKVRGMRKVQLSWFQKAQLLSARSNFILNCIPVLVTVTSFGLFTLFGGDVSPSRAFTSMSLFAILRMPLNMLPNLITQAEKPTLSNINLEIPVGSLVAVVGGSGEEKTSLISAMIGELPPIDDSTVVIRGTVAYVPQISWIFNATVRENILFGSNFETSRYWKTIDVTAFQHDLDLLPVFNNCIKEELQGKTRVLVTNQLHFLPEVDNIFLINEGMVKEEGTFEELSRSGIVPKAYGECGENGRACG